MLDNFSFTVFFLEYLPWPWTSDRKTPRRINKASFKFEVQNCTKALQKMQANKG